MLYYSHPPSPPLDAFIECLWFCSDAPPPGRERILPRGTLELVINLREDSLRGRPAERDGWRELSGAVVSGAYSRYFSGDPHARAALLGVHFRAGGAFPFLGLPAGELADAHVDLEALWGRGASELRERLLEATTLAGRFALMEEALLRRLRGRPERHRAVAAALHALGTAEEEVRVGELARDIGLCQRRLIQVFTAEVGMTPKRYQRVRRFQRAQVLMRKVPHPDWAAIAAECGYFDQSHLILEFRHIAGFTPAELQRRCSVDLLSNHLVVGDAGNAGSTPATRGRSLFSNSEGGDTS